MTSAKQNELALAAFRVAIVMPALFPWVEFEQHRIYAAKWLQVGRQCRRCGKQVKS